MSNGTEKFLFPRKWQVAPLCILSAGQVLAFLENTSFI
jgi:hypothetical protein